MRNQFANSWFFYKKNFLKLSSFSFAITIIIASGIILTFMGLDQSIFLTILGMCIIASAGIPLLYSYQHAILKSVLGIEYDYNELYSNYRLYYRMNTKNTYGVLRALIFSLLISFVISFLMGCVYELSFPDYYYAGEKIIFGDNPAKISEISYENIIQGFQAMKYYEYFFAASCLLTSLVFFYKIRKNLMLPYLTNKVFVPVALSQIALRNVLIKNRKNQRYTFIPSILFAILFAIGYMLTSSLLYTFNEDLLFKANFTVIGLSIAAGLLLNFLLLPMYFINFTYLADTLEPQFMIQLKILINKVNIKFREINKSSEDESSDDQ